jgi:hypothetical protein
MTGKSLFTVLILSLLLGAYAASAASIPPEVWSPAWADNCGRVTIAPGGGEDLVDPEAGNDYRIHVIVMDFEWNPIPGVLTTDLWLQHPDMVPCDAPFSWADAPTDENGYTTFSGTIHSGVGGDGSEGLDCNEMLLSVYAYGVILNDGLPVCVAVDSPDLNGDREVSLPDFVKFSVDYNCADQGGACDPCHDYNEDDQTSLADFTIFRGYYNQSSCP